MGLGRLVPVGRVGAILDERRQVGAQVAVHVGGIRHQVRLIRSAGPVGRRGHQRGVHRIRARHAKPRGRVERVGERHHVLERDAARPRLGQRGRGAPAAPSGAKVVLVIVVAVDERPAAEAQQPRAVESVEEVGVKGLVGQGGVGRVDVDARDRRDGAPAPATRRAQLILHTKDAHVLERGARVGGHDADRDAGGGRGDVEEVATTHRYRIVRERRREPCVAAERERPVPVEVDGILAGGDRGAAPTDVCYCGLNLERVVPQPPAGQGDRVAVCVRHVRGSQAVLLPGLHLHARIMSGALHLPVCCVLEQISEDTRRGDLPLGDAPAIRGHRREVDLRSRATQSSAWGNHPTKWFFLRAGSPQHPAALGGQIL